MLLAGFSLNVSAQTLTETPKTQTHEIASSPSPAVAASAKRTTSEMNNLLTMTADQQHKIFQVVINHEEQYAIVKGSTLTQEEKEAKYASLEAKKLAEFQRILTPEQMATYNTSKTASKQ